MEFRIRVKHIQRKTEYRRKSGTVRLKNVTIMNQNLGYSVQPIRKKREYHQSEMAWWYFYTQNQKLHRCNRKM